MIYSEQGRSGKYGYDDKNPGVYILENTPAPWGGKISADVIWGKKYEKPKRKKGKM